MKNCQKPRVIHFDIRELPLREKVCEVYSVAYKRSLGCEACNLLAFKYQTKKLKHFKWKFTEKRITNVYIHINDKFYFYFIFIKSVFSMLLETNEVYISTLNLTFLTKLL